MKNMYRCTFASITSLCISHCMC